MTPETPPPADRDRTRLRVRHIRPSDVESVRHYTELGWQVRKTARDHFGPGEHALVLVREAAS